jgi:hypothetical protein
MLVTGTECYCISVGNGVLGEDEKRKYTIPQAARLSLKNLCSNSKRARNLSGLYITVPVNEITKPDTES